MGRFLLVFLIPLLLSTNGFASHIAGAQLTWSCIGNNQYLFELLLVRDCNGITLGGNQTIEFQSSCGTVPPLSLPPQNPGGTEISEVCPSQLQNTTCNGGTLPGYQEHLFTGITTLPPCGLWTASWSVCCRNAAIVNLVGPGAADSYIEATLNTLDVPCPSSIGMTGRSAPFACINETYAYSVEANSNTGDSLSYELVSALEVNAVPILYAAGFSPGQPIPGAQINPVTGLLTFTPTTMGSFVIVVKVSSYDGLGTLTGTVMKDFVVQTLSCTNSPPAIFAGNIQSTSGTISVLDSTSVAVCPGDSFCFDIVITDPDITDTLTLSSNVADVLPWATVAFTSGNPLNAQICGTTPISFSNDQQLVLSVFDDNCPVPSNQQFVYNIIANGSTIASSDQFICGSQAAQLNALGGTLFNWSVLSGDPIVVGQNFSCNPCSSPIATPNVTTTYLVTSDLAGTCAINVDTVTVNVVNDFAVNTSTASTICAAVPISINTNVTPAGSYLYSWSPATFLSDPSIADPTVSITAPGLYTYVLTVSSALGCVRKDSLTIEVVPNGAAFSLDSVGPAICVGQSSTIGVSLQTAPFSCGVDSVVCAAGTFSGEIGFDQTSNASNTYPAPYGNFSSGARHQMLFRASELTAAGFSAGKILELAWNIDNVNGTSTYQNFEIRMGCTTQNSLTQWLNGTTVVFPAQTVNISAGWNVHPLFGTGYNWDGSSNLVVEICFDLTGISGNTLNSSTFFSSTAFNSTLFFNSSVGGVCNTGAFIISTNRPNTRFTFCEAASTALNFMWDPPVGVADPNSPSTLVTPPSLPFTYTVTVTDTITGCSNTASTTLTSVTGGFSVNGNVFTANQQGATYQWLDCNAGLAPIPGATGQQYTATGWANLALAVTFNGCSDTTACQQTVGILETEEFADLAIYPNPSDGDFTVTFGKTLTGVTMTIYDLEGRLLSGDKLQPSSSQKISLDLAPGVYLVNFNRNGQEITERLVITDHLNR